MVAYGGHAPIANRCEFEFENESQISNSNITQVGARFEYGRQIRIQTNEGIGTCWEESPRLAIDTKVYKRM